MRKKWVRNAVALGIATCMTVTTGMPAMGMQEEIEKEKEETTQFKYGHVSVDNNSYAAVLPETTKKVAAHKALQSTYIPEEIGTEDYPAIRDQSPYGTCWAFAATAMAELNLWKKYGIVEDLSELQLVYMTTHFNEEHNGYGELADNNIISKFTNGAETFASKSAAIDASYLEVGGNYIYTTKGMQAWVGMIPEEEQPYENAKNLIEWNSETKKAVALAMDEEYKREKDILHVQNVYTLAYDSSSTTQMQEMKNLIKNQGSVGIAYHHDENKYSSLFNSLYQGSKIESNHEVVVVGWDDTKEVNGTSKKGAWLVRNSWGGKGEKLYSQKGYFWLSYYDATICNTVYALDCAYDEGTDEDEFYDHIYQFDGAYEDAVAYNTTLPEINLANVYRVEDNEILKAVSVDVVKNAGTNIALGEVPYEVNIYLGEVQDNDPTKGELVAKETGSFYYAGYQTIKLSQPVELEKDDIISIVVTLKKGDNTGILFSREVSDATGIIPCKATSKAGESFQGYNGVWKDLGADKSGNLRIKAYTDDMPEVEEDDTELTWDGQDEVLVLNVEDTLTVDYEMSSNTYNDQDVEIESSEERVAIYDKETKTISALAPGNAILTVKAGEHEAKLYVMVSPKDLQITYDGEINAMKLWTEQEIYCSEGALFQAYFSDAEQDDFEDADQDEEIEPSVLESGKKEWTLETPEGPKDVKYSLIWDTPVGTEEIDGICEYFYEIQYHLNGGNNSTKNVAQAKEFITLANPSKANQVFLGWYYDEEFEQPVEGKLDYSKLVEDKLDVYAKWKQKLGQPYLATPINTVEGIKLRWTKVAAAEGYYVCHKVADATEVVKLEGAETTEYTVSKNEEALVGGYWIVAYDAYGEMKASNEANCCYLEQVKAPKLTNVSQGVKLTWSKVAMAEEYVVYRKKGTGNYARLGTTKETNFIDSKTGNGVLYTYMIVATCQANTFVSANGKEASIVRLKGSRITNARNLATKKAYVTWERDAYAKGYQFYYKVGTKTKKITIVGNRNVTKTLQRLTKNKTYSFKVRSYKVVANKTYYSAWSSTKKVTIKK